ncbi:MAG: SPOR domain-containing protein [Ketobacteraceae bacterium]|nr:SPOR domain-containing protein [Ketobacteraceae bacterium]
MADSHGSQLPAWAWLMTGVITGLFLAFLYYLAGIKVPEGQQAASTPAPAESSGRKAPKFDFYTVLPDLESMADKAPKTRPAEKQTDRAATTRHMIQTGSFQNIQDADRRRAELLLLGLDVQTQKVELSPGQIFHRVQVGPFSDPAALKKARATLNENNIEHIVLTLK